MPKKKRKPAATKPAADESAPRGETREAKQTRLHLARRAQGQGD